MQPLRLIAAAAIATGGLAFAAPALAAPKGPAAMPEAGSVTLVAGQRGVEDSDWLKDQDDRDRRRERSRERDQDRKDGRAERRQERREERQADRGDRRDDDWRRNDGRQGDWGHGRWGDQDHQHDWNRQTRNDHDRRWGDDRRNDWGNSYRWGYPYGWNRGNHYGWDRGNHYGWDRGARYGWRPGYGQPGRHVRAYHHPQYRYWVGRHLPRRNYDVVRRYEDYYLPRPGRGTYYARYDNDVYLVAESTRRILDAFLLVDGNYRR